MKAIKGILAILLLLGLAAVMIFIIVLLGYLAIAGAVALGGVLV